MNPAPPGGRGSGGQAAAVGATWWGRAWLEALEGRAAHDPGRLPRGRTIVRQGRVGPLSVEPGRVRGEVSDADGARRDVLVQIREFRPDEWDCVLDAITTTAGHTAALLDGELDPGIDAAARAVDVELLPRSGELRTACSCADWAEPCEHAAAVCHLVAGVLDVDPFALLELRGLRRAEVLDAVRARRGLVAMHSDGETGDAAARPTDGADRIAAVAPTTDGPDRIAAAAPTTDGPDQIDAADLLLGGVGARSAWSRTPGQLPPPPHPPRVPRPPAAWPSDPPAGAPFTAEGLRRLAVDAAARAWALRTGGSAGPGGTTADGAALGLDEPADLARRAAATDEAGRRALASRAGLTDAVLAARAEAWAAAGADGLRLLDEPSWTAPPMEIAAVRDRLVELGAPPSRVRVRSDRVTVGGGLQLRRSRDGRWYRLEKASGRWVLTAPPSVDVDDLIGPEVDLGG